MGILSFFLRVLEMKLRWMGSVGWVLEFCVVQWRKGGRVGLALLALRFVGWDDC